MFGEDLYINKFFKYKKKGFYVDVGAYHPLDGSNTYLLYRDKDWGGINIDINSISIELFKKSRMKDINLNIGISNKKGIQNIYFRKEINMLNTLSKKFAKKQFLKGFFSKKIYIDRLDNILNKSKYKNKKIDFLNIDVEGNEINVLKSLNFDKYVPKLICIEIHSNNENFKDKSNFLINNLIYKFLIKKKYTLVWSKAFSYIFKKNDKLF